MLLSLCDLDFRVGEVTTERTTANGALLVGALVMLACAIATAVCATDFTARTGICMCGCLIALECASTVVAANKVVLLAFLCVVGCCALGNRVFEVQNENVDDNPVVDADGLKEYGTQDEIGRVGC